MGCALLLCPVAVVFARACVLMHLVWCCLLTRACAAQAAQVYAASIMFGYFVRRVDKRFQLDRQLGLLDEPQADAVARLERLFNTASDPDDLDQPTSPITQDAAAPSASSSGDAGAAGQAAAAAPGQGSKKKQSPLRKYIQSFDQATLADMTRQVVSRVTAAVCASSCHAHCLSLSVYAYECCSQRMVHSGSAESLDFTLGSQICAVPGGAGLRTCKSINVTI